MTGQLNTNLLNSNSEEIQEELDTLSNRIDGVESVTSANTDKINEIGTKVDNLSNSVSTSSLTATKVKSTSIDSSSATITNLTAGAATISGKLNAANIEATAITAGNINGDVSAGTVDATNANVTNANVAGKITAASAKLTDAEVTNAKANTASVTGLLNAGSIKAGNTEAAALTSKSADISGSLCVHTDAKVDGTATAKCVISENIQASEAIITDGYVQASCVCGPIQSANAKITTAAIDNLTVNSSLSLGAGISIGPDLGSTTHTKVTTDSLIVNGDTELNGAVKAGSITISDGSITAGEVCIGAKGTVIDADKNASFADVTANTVTASAATISGKITTDCIESKDVVSTNTFACNLYPENITIDKDVGNLHYSRQLDTDAVGGILVDCKTVKVKTNKETTDASYTYKDVEANYASCIGQTYENTKNGIAVTSVGTRKEGNCDYDYYDNQVCFVGAYDWQRNGYEGIKIASCKVVPTSGDTVKQLEVAAFDTLTQCYCPFIQMKCNSFGTYVCSLADYTELRGCLKFPNVRTCSTTDSNKYALKVDGDGCLYQGMAGSSLISNSCETLGSCIIKYSCVSQYPSRWYDYCIQCSDDVRGSYNIANVCYSVDGGYKFRQCCSCTPNSCFSYGNCVCTTNTTDTDCQTKCSWYNTSDVYCFVCQSSKDMLGCAGTDYSLHFYCCKKGESACCNYYEHLCNQLGGKYYNNGIKPSTICRCVQNNPQFSWQVCICDDNLYITNPQCILTCDGKNKKEDILRVEDGKIYTKCGEFAGGGSGGYFDDATFENDCICATRSIVDDTITTCVGTKKDSCNNRFSIITNPYSVVLSCCKQTTQPMCLTFYDRSKYGYSWLTPIAVQCQCYRDNNCSLEYDFLNQSMAITDEDGRVVCCVTQDQNIEGCYKFNSDTNVCTQCEKHCYKQAWISERNQCGTCIYIDCCDYSIDTSLECNCYHCEQYGLQAVRSPTLSVTNYYCNTNIEHDGSETPYCVGHSCSCMSPRTYTFCFENSYKDICACSCSDEGSYRICYDCGAIHYDCNSTYTRFFNGDCLCGCKYNTTTCQYETFDVHSCINIDDKSIDKSVMINNCYVSLKEKVVGNTIANLPTTNALVPLAGKVNGIGFAFFCKGADGTKFYDSNFAVVDAGSATNVTYLVTTGA